MVFLKFNIFKFINGEREHKNYGTTIHKNTHLLLHSYKTECRACGGGLNHYLSFTANNLIKKK